MTTRRGTIVALLGREDDPKFIGRLATATGGIVFTFSPSFGPHRADMLNNALERMRKRDLLIKKAVEDGRNLLLINYVPRSLMDAPDEATAAWIVSIHQSLPKPDLVLMVGAPPTSVSGMVTLLDMGHDDMLERAVTVVKSVFVLGNEVLLY